jgi:DtxR family Mn-dependent transcriptional regulator
MEEKKIDEILEEIWIEREQGRLSQEELFKKAAEEKIEARDLEELENSGYLVRKSNSVELTEKGERHAAQIIRGHRLAERLFTDVLELETRYLETQACSFEHLVNLEVAEAICTLLGHPRECPHGRAIPKGECCLRAQKEVESLILPLSELSAGTKAKVLYITTRHHPRMLKLSSLGILPGVQIKIDQTYPSYIIRFEETQLALDRDILKDIYVRRLT